MRKGVFLSICLILFIFYGFSFSELSFAQQIKPNSPQITIKTYYCALVEDILIYPTDFNTNTPISVGVKLKFTRQVYTPSGKGLCNCAFEVSSENLTHAWGKRMSLRLIGIKYSETETNVLKYIGPTPSFTPYTYSGFQVVGFIVNENDIKKGYKYVGTWVPRQNPLNDNRTFRIFATLDVNGYALTSDNDPDYLRKGCFPSGDFVKSFQAKRIEISGTDLERGKEGVKKTSQIISKLPDLAIEKAEIYSKNSKRENEQGIIYDEAQLKFNVTNKGKSDVAKLKVKIERKWDFDTDYSPERGSKLNPTTYQLGYYGNDGKWYTIKNGEVTNGIIELENLQAGGYRTIFIFTDNSFAPKLNCWFRITIDPENEIAELDEGNNIIANILFKTRY